jgi:hypothetical protein
VVVAGMVGKCAADAHVSFCESCNISKVSLLFVFSIFLISIVQCSLDVLILISHGEKARLLS